MSAALPRALAAAALLLVAAAALLLVAAAPAVAQAPADAVATPRNASDEDAATAWWTAEVARILAAVEDHPAIGAAAAALAAADAELAGVHAPVALDAEMSGTRLDVADPDTPPPPGALPDGVELPSGGWTSQASIRATLRPFVAGDLADLRDQRRVEVVRAAWTLRETRANLQAAALEAAAGVHVAREGVAIAERALELARRSEDATALRAERGGATAGERERARLDADRARERLRAARAALTEARAGLASLTGLREGLEEVPLPPAVRAPAPDVARAEADVALARVGLRSATRALAPTAFANYAWNAEDGAWSVSLESRTWQPTVGYETPGPFDGGAGSAPADVPAEMLPSVEGSLTVGLQVSLGGDAIGGRVAAESRERAAAAGLEAARADARLAELSRDEAVRAARAELDFARRDVELVRAETRDARRRLELGLEMPLAVASEELALRRAELGLLTARTDLLSALLRGYRELAVPLSEVRP